MLSSTINSNFKSKVIVILLTLLVSYGMMNSLLIAFSNVMTLHLEQMNLYQDNLAGQADLLWKVSQQKPLDVVFVGNSTTKMHIDPALFHHEKMSVFSYSLLGYTFSQYPAMVANAIKAHPKMIVISLNKPELFLPATFFYKNFNHQSDLTWYSLRYLSRYMHSTDDQAFYRSILKSYLLNLNYFHYYGFAIRDYLSNVYDNHHLSNPFVNPNPKFVCGNPVPDHRYRSCNHGDYSTYDGIPDHIDDHAYQQTIYHSSKELNPTLIALLNGMTKQIAAAGIEPVIVFIPEFSHHLFENGSPSTFGLQARVIDDSSLSMQKNAWHDTEHLNARGKLIYSQNIVNSLKQTLLG